MTEGDLREIIEKNGKLRIFKSHETVISEGDRVDKMYYIRKGGMILQFVNPYSFVEKTVNFFTPSFHRVATVAESLYLEKPSEYNLKTFTNTEALIISKAKVEKLFVENEDFKNFFTDMGIRSLIEKNTLRNMLLTLSAEEMFRYLMEHFPAVLNEVPSKYVADFLGVSPQWLSKLKRKV
ncbi:hypothetical protein FUAX_17540 [Fulvitalea axinellae]|uniref:Cyclic nucleotide-binding domain-containing protein n=1 Tax=Fulvitalea axinellae TaxID=1182444 RepID=A0AAU9CV46_9BACT|nr:hypothetical protein FUAX_17540 [Fulvitalea axinellae]